MNLASFHAISFDLQTLYQETSAHINTQYETNKHETNKNETSKNEMSKKSTGIQKIK